MCRWGCTTCNTTYMCKWCGTRYCKDCLRGDFGTGHMTSPDKCRQCNQKRCQGPRVEYVPKIGGENEKENKGKSASRMRGLTRNVKSAKSEKKVSFKKSGKKKKR